MSRTHPHPHRGGQPVPSVEVRPFRRDDRDQLTELVNAHVGAVLPGVSVSVNTVMRQLEREPGELIVDPWVVERRALVAVERDAVVAGALLLRYGAGERVSASYRDSGEIRWLVCRRDAKAAGDALVAAALEVMAGWRVAKVHSDPSLPALATYGVPDCWPHLAALYERSGFVARGHVEVILVAHVDALPRDVAPPLDGLRLRRSVGDCGTRFTAVRGNDVLGFVEVESDLTDGGTRSRLAGWSDVGNLLVGEPHRRQGVATWMLAGAADWLRLGGVERLVAYAMPADEDELAFYASAGFRELTRTRRGWVLER
jgi:GNAT superfamily N-acetyltransferase